MACNLLKTWTRVQFAKWQPRTEQKRPRGRGILSCPSYDSVTLCGMQTFFGASFFNLWSLHDEKGLSSYIILLLINAHTHINLSGFQHKKWFTLHFKYKKHLRKNKQKGFTSWLGPGIQFCLICAWFLGESWSLFRPDVPLSQRLISFVNWMFHMLNNLAKK